MARGRKRGFPLRASPGWSCSWRGDAWEPWAPPEGFTKEALELEILFRQNYSWQGRLRLPKIGKEAVFRSVLELLLIIETYFES